jgi:hypothetical protein
MSGTFILLWLDIWGQSMPFMAYVQWLEQLKIFFLNINWQEHDDNYNLLRYKNIHLSKNKNIHGTYIYLYTNNILKIITSTAKIIIITSTNNILKIIIKKV